jgi:hypothetical protein
VRYLRHHTTRKKTKSPINIDISGTSSFLVTPNEDSFDFSVDSQIKMY